MGSCYRHHSAEALLQETGSLVSLPEVCLKLRAVLTNPDHNMQEVADVIVHDPALTTRLLRIVNSAWFGLRVAVRDVSHALAILGEHDLYNLAVVTSLVQKLTLPDDGFDIRQFWKTSVLSGVLARNMARTVNIENREELFITGLLLNMGKLPLYYREPELCRTVARLSLERRCDASLVERELLGFDHAEVGGCLAKAWNFSDLLVESIALHHQEPAATQSLPCRIAVIAGGIGERADLVALDNGVELEDCPVDLLIRANIEEAAFPEILKRSCLEYREVYDTFFGHHHGP